jgi:hypothetical protein
MLPPYLSRLRPKPLFSILRRPATYSARSACRGRTPRRVRKRLSMDYEVQHCTRHCSTTGREFAPGETYYSALVDDAGNWKRLDFAAEAWAGPPADAVGWWKSKIPLRHNTKKHWAPNNVMLDFWDTLANQPDRQDIRYVLTLLLVRRRVFRWEDENSHDEHQWLTVYCPRRDATYDVSVVAPEPTRIDQIQEELASLLR